MKSIPVISSDEATRFFSAERQDYTPVVIRGLCAHWPMVNQSTEDVVKTLLAHSAAVDVSAFKTPLEDRGELRFNENADGFNFLQRKMPFADCLRAIFQETKTPTSCMYMGSSHASRVTPNLMATHPLPIVPAGTEPRLWIGNESLIGAHYDVSDNIAVVVAGRRRFTLFPPAQIDNLYIGPMDVTPAGQPMSMVSLRSPDIARFPKFERALSEAYVADLEPGDAIFIPSLWWHAVEGMDRFNMLVNYWWNANSIGVDSGNEALVHSILTISQLPLAERQAWKAFFDHYVFQESHHPLDFLPEDMRGVLGSMNDERYRMLRRYLLMRMGVQ
jgi:hypothetical protein